MGAYDVHRTDRSARRGEHNLIIPILQRVTYHVNTQADSTLNSPVLNSCSPGSLWSHRLSAKCWSMAAARGATGKRRKLRFRSSWTMGPNPDEGGPKNPQCPGDAKVTRRQQDWIRHSLSRNHRKHLEEEQQEGPTVEVVDRRLNPFGYIAHRSKRAPDPANQAMPV
jgi:hypothetical protein